MEQAARSHSPPDLRLQYLHQIQANHEVRPLGERAVSSWASLGTHAHTLRCLPTPWCCAIPMARSRAAGSAPLQAGVGRRGAAAVPLAPFPCLSRWLGPPVTSRAWSPLSPATSPGPSGPGRVKATPKWHVCDESPPRVWWCAQQEVGPELLPPALRSCFGRCGPCVTSCVQRTRPVPVLLPRGSCRCMHSFAALASPCCDGRPVGPALWGLAMLPAPLGLAMPPWLYRERPEHERLLSSSCA